MHRVEYQIRQLSGGIMKTGNHPARKRVRSRMIAIMLDITQHENITDIRQLGRAHVHRYWNRNSHLSPATLRDHYYAIEKVWQVLLRRSSAPPNHRA
ncbi:hypothetical protein ACQKPX_24255 [Photobacterium sp. DNB23_23_1]|uniref:Integrase n=1 Tax=Photobacterium pectinilyticum TaxID=2906793 RepID=A0ABT1N6N8_9GAMM|nr:hypothetical protein [Photobacterium sp. ZSDE20]MCQ1058899.1 hypothetical protein [Photobacterium sp. ZSDE20]MDD1823811.1 hypothetical protein [Photobacterium sp. ZSDE20]